MLVPTGELRESPSSFSPKNDQEDSQCGKWEKLPWDFPSLCYPSPQPQMPLAVAGTAAVGLRAPSANAKGQNSLCGQELCSREGKRDLHFSLSTLSSANVAPDVDAAARGTQRVNP